MIGIQNKLGEDFEKVLSEWEDEPFCPVSLIVLDDRDLKLAAAWRFLPKWLERPPSNRYTVWAWIMFRPVEWTSLAHVEIEDLDLRFERLKILRVIRPDETIPSEVQEHIERLRRRDSVRWPVCLDGAPGLLGDHVCMLTESCCASPVDKT
jgi:hypothetical protein